MRLELLLLLELELLELLDLLSLGELVLLVLDGLNPQHLKLEHLHLRLGLGVEVLGETWAEGDTGGVHGAVETLLGCEAVVRPIDCGSHWMVVEGVERLLGEVVLEVE